ncbi:MAG TPA: hypothetical protein VKD69_19010 [Vicinamibacterales bacterium]|nr:hypothetical protein [Vicinamibacterales bacterium]
MRRRVMPLIVCLVLTAATMPPRTLAQKAAPTGKAPQPGTTTPVDSRSMSPAELRKMFDSYAMMNAQEQLKISNDKFPNFLMQYKALQDKRRTASQEHGKMLAELRQQAADGKATDAQLRDRLKALRDLEERSHNDVRKAYDELDKVLDVKQQARFRVFEQQMDRRVAQALAQARRPAPAKAVK